MPNNIKYGVDIPKNLASRVVDHFFEKSDSSEARKLIVERLPSNCADVRIPKLRESVLNMRSFTEYAKRHEKSLFSLQTAIVQGVSCFTNLLDEALAAEDKSQVLDTKVLLRNYFDGITMLMGVPPDQFQI